MTDPILLKRITADPEIFGGKPIIRGMRISVELILSLLAQGEKPEEAALALEEMLLTRQPEEIFAAEDETDWRDWIEFFSRTREPDRRRKGLVEVQL